MFIMEVLDCSSTFKAGIHWGFSSMGNLTSILWSMVPPLEPNGRENAITGLPVMQRGIPRKVQVKI